MRVVLTALCLSLVLAAPVSAMTREQLDEQGASEALQLAGMLVFESDLEEPTIWADVDCRLTERRRGSCALDVSDGAAAWCRSLLVVRQSPRGLLYREHRGLQCSTPE